MSDNYLFSAIVLSYNSVRYITQCIEHLAAALAAFDARSEIHIIENGSTDGSRAAVEVLAEAYPDLVIPQYFSQNLGTTSSRNHALRRARGEYILVLDSDALINYETLAGLREYLAAHQDVGLVAPKLVYPDGRFQLSYDQFPTVSRKLQRMLSLRAIERSVDSPVSPTQVDYAISACWLLPRRAISQVGLLDEQIFYSPEDVDYCVRLWATGLRIVYLPTVSAVHDAQELSRGAKIGKFTWKHAAGLLYFFRKHQYLFSRDRLVRRLARQAAAPSPAGLPR